MQLNSNKTPIGGHIVSEKIGGGEKINTIFKGRVPTHLSDSILHDVNAKVGTLTVKIDIYTFMELRMKMKLELLLQTDA